MKNLAFCLSFLAAFAAAAVGASAAPLCSDQLEDADYAALASAPGRDAPFKISGVSGKPTPEQIQQIRDQVDAMDATEFETQQLCVARLFVKKANNGKNSNPSSYTEEDIPIGLSNYVSAAEYKWASPLATRVMALAMNQKGIVHPKS